MDRSRWTRTWPLASAIVFLLIIVMAIGAPGGSPKIHDAGQEVEPLCHFHLKGPESLQRYDLAILKLTNHLKRLGAIPGEQSEDIESFWCGFSPPLAEALSNTLSGYLAKDRNGNELPKGVTVFVTPNEVYRGDSIKTLTFNEAASQEYISIALEDPNAATQETRNLTYFNEITDYALQSLDKIDPDVLGKMTVNLSKVYSLAVKQYIRATYPDQDRWVLWDDVHNSQAETALTGYLSNAVAEGIISGFSIDLNRELITYSFPFVPNEGEDPITVQQNAPIRLTSVDGFINDDRRRAAHEWETRDSIAGILSWAHTDNAGLPLRMGADPIEEVTKQIIDGTIKSANDKRYAFFEALGYQAQLDWIDTDDPTKMSPGGKCPTAATTHVGDTITPSNSVLTMLEFQDTYEHTQGIVRRHLRKLFDDFNVTNYFAANNYPDSTTSFVRLESNLCLVQKARSVFFSNHGAENGWVLANSQLIEPRSYAADRELCCATLLNNQKAIFGEEQDWTRCRDNGWRNITTAEDGLLELQVVQKHNLKSFPWIAGEQDRVCGVVLDLPRTMREGRLGDKDYIHNIACYGGRYLEAYNGHTADAVLGSPLPQYFNSAILDLLLIQTDASSANLYCKDPSLPLSDDPVSKENEKGSIISRNLTSKYYRPSDPDFFDDNCNDEARVLSSMGRTVQESVSGRGHYGVSERLDGWRIWDKPLEDSITYPHRVEIGSKAGFLIHKEAQIAGDPNTKVEFYPIVRSAILDEGSRTIEIKFSSAIDPSSIDVSSLIGSEQCPARMSRDNAENSQVTVGPTGITIALSSGLPLLPSSAWINLSDGAFLDQYGYDRKDYPSKITVSLAAYTDVGINLIGNVATASSFWGFPTPGISYHNAPFEFGNGMLLGSIKNQSQDARTFKVEFPCAPPPVCCKPRFIMWDSNPNDDLPGSIVDDGCSCTEGLSESECKTSYCAHDGGTWLNFNGTEEDCANGRPDSDGDGVPDGDYDYGEKSGTHHLGAECSHSDPPNDDGSIERDCEHCIRGTDCHTSSTDYFEEWSIDEHEEAVCCTPPRHCQQLPPCGGSCNDDGNSSSSSSSSSGGSTDGSVGKCPPGARNGIYYDGGLGQGDCFDGSGN